MSGLIALDWGTSSLRAMLMDGDGVVTETRRRPWGIRQLPDGGFAAALDDVINGWPSLPRIASGMVAVAADGAKWPISSYRLAEPSLRLR